MPVRKGFNYKLLGQAQSKTVCLNSAMEDDDFEADQWLEMKIIDFGQQLKKADETENEIKQVDAAPLVGKQVPFLISTIDENTTLDVHQLLCKARTTLLKTSRVYAKEETTQIEILRDLLPGMQFKTQGFSVGKVGIDSAIKQYTENWSNIFEWKTLKKCLDKLVRKLLLEKLAPVRTKKHHDFLKKKKEPAIKTKGPRRKKKILDLEAALPTCISVEELEEEKIKRIDQDLHSCNDSETDTDSDNSDNDSITNEENDDDVSDSNQQTTDDSQQQNEDLSNTTIKKITKWISARISTYENLGLLNSEIILDCCHAINNERQAILAAEIIRVLKPLFPNRRYYDIVPIHLGLPFLSCYNYWMESMEYFKMKRKVFAG